MFVPIAAHFFQVRTRRRHLVAALLSRCVTVAGRCLGAVVPVADRCRARVQLLSVEHRSSGRGGRFVCASILSVVAAAEEHNGTSSIHYHSKVWSRFFSIHYIISNKIHIHQRSVPVPLPPPATPHPGESAWVPPPVTPPHKAGEATRNDVTEIQAGLETNLQKNHLFSEKAGAP